jgi:hypothetical protein
MTADLSLLAVLITTCATAVIGIISQIQHSRCSKIKCCGGLISCTREVPDVVEPEVDLSEIKNDIDNNVLGLVPKNNK